MPLHENDGVPGVPEGYVGKAISVMECALHGAHINLDLYLPPRIRWDMATFITSTAQGQDAPLPIDQMTPDQAESFARDMLEAVEQARAIVASQHN